MSKLENEMVPVPIPTEIPQPPSLDQIPMEILHSATVELLIQQNEDLSSRLKVNIRRNSQLELTILKKDREIKDLNQKKENVLAQIEIIKEKEKIWSERQKKNEKKITSFQSESDLLELRYNELYSTSQQKAKEQQKLLAEKHRENETLKKKLYIAKKVRIRAKEKLRSFLIEVASGLHSNEKNRKKSESSNKLLKKHFASLKDEIDQKENFFKEQLHNFKKISQKKLFEIDQKLSASLEQNKIFKQEKEDLQEEIARLNLEFHEEKKNRNKLAILTEQLQELKNQKLELKHNIDQKDSQWSAACESERSKNRALQKELSEFKKIFEEQKQLLKTCEDKILSLSKDNKEISYQLSSVQKLWISSQDKLEKSELKSESLERINRELSRSNKSEKLERLREQSTPTVTIEEGDKLKESNDEIIDRELQEKIKNAFAGQYSNFNKSPEA